ncbi:MAG: hypothetical protein KDD38_01080 [Bdellovibrionales bacterium]|nr:hypothetical protein [Bdellovibrionales bacterium]
MKYLILKYFLGFSLIFGLSLTQFVHADDLDDIEADMDSTIAESDAAQSAAKAAERREAKARAELEAAKSDAAAAMSKAKAKEAEAAAQIKILETKIANSKIEKTKHEKLKAVAEKKIIKAQEKVAAKTSDAEAARVASEVAKTEKETQEKILSDLQEQQRGLEKKIMADREEMTKISSEIVELKKKQGEKEKALVRLRANAKQQASNRDKLKTQRDQLKRNVSSVPAKVVYRSPKVNCAVTDMPSDGAQTIGSIKKGSKYELYRVVDRRWVELQVGNKRGFAAKTCF